MSDRPRCVAGDADPAVNRLLAEVLARAGFEVRPLAGPWELAAAPLDGVALVVLGGGGRGTSAAAARALRAAGDRTSVVILVNSPDPAAAALAAADPAVRLVEKPFVPADLTAAVADLLGG